MSDDKTVERGKHTDQRAVTPDQEKRNKLLFLGVACLVGAGFVALQFREKTPKTVEKKVIRGATFEPTKPAVEFKTVASSVPQSATVAAPAVVAAAVMPSPDPLLLAAQRAPLMGLNKRNNVLGAASDGTQRVGVFGQEIEADDKGAFERRLKSPVLTGVKAGVIGDLNYVIPQATSIHASWKRRCSRISQGSCPV